MFASFSNTTKGCKFHDWSQFQWIHLERAGAGITSEKCQMPTPIILRSRFQAQNHNSTTEGSSLLCRDLATLRDPWQPCAILTIQ